MRYYLTASSTRAPFVHHACNRLCPLFI